MREIVQDFVGTTGLDLWQSFFLKGAFLAQDKKSFGANFNTQRDDGLSLTEQECKYLRIEKTTGWKLKQPWALWRLVALCALGAAVQGWDEAAVAGGRIL